MSQGKSYFHILNPSPMRTCDSSDTSPTIACNDLPCTNNQIRKYRLLGNKGSAGQLWLEDTGGPKYDAKCVPSIVVNKAPHFYPSKGIHSEVYQDCGIKVECLK